jgi:hypothetical protein
MHSLPATLVASTISSVAVDPALVQMQTEISLFKSLHVTPYGFVINHPYAVTVTGAQAVIKDCMDASHAGSIYTLSHTRRSVGVARDNTTAALVKGADGVWRVKNVVYLLDVKC